MCRHFRTVLVAGVILERLPISWFHGPALILVVQRQLKLEFDRPSSLLQLSVLPTLPVTTVEGRGGAPGNHTLVPVPVVLQRVKNVLCVRLNQVSPRLPQRVDDIIDEANLE